MLAEKAGEMTPADVRLGGDVIHLPWGFRCGGHQILCAVNGGMKMIAIPQPRRKLRVIARAAKIDHHFSRYVERGLCAKATGNNMQCQVDTGGDARAGQYK